MDNRLTSISQIITSSSSSSNPHLNFNNLDMDKLSSVLQKIGLIENPFTEKQKSIISNPTFKKTKEELEKELKEQEEQKKNLDEDEDNQISTSMNIKKISQNKKKEEKVNEENKSDKKEKEKKKDTELISITSQIFSYPNIKVEEIYEVYSKIFNLKGNCPYNLEDFKLIIKIISLILSNFNDDLFKLDLNDNDLFENIKKEKFYIFMNNSIHEHYRENLNFIDKEIPLLDKYTSKVKNLSILIYIATLFNEIVYSNITLDIIMSNIDLYNSLIFSNIKMLLFIQFHIAILSNLNIKKCMQDNIYNLENSENRALIKNKKFKFTNSTIPTFYYLSNYNANLSNIINYDNILIQLLFKLYLVPYILREFMLTINIHLLSFENLKLLDDIFTKIKLNYKGKNLGEELVITPLNFILLVSSVDQIQINQLDLILNNIKNKEMLVDFFQTYTNLVILSDNVEATFDNIILKESDNFNEFNLYNDYDTLIWLLRYIIAVKSLKKKRYKIKAKIFNFKLVHNSFSLILNKDIINKLPNKRERNLIVTLNQSLFKENEFLNYLSQKQNFKAFYEKLKLIIKEFYEYKKYHANIRLSLYPINNFELNYYMNLIYLMIQNYVKEHMSLKNNIVVYENEYINYHYTLNISSLINPNERISYFNKYLSSFKTTYLKTLTKFYDRYAKCFSNFLLHDELDNTYPFTPRVLLRHFNGNTLVIINKSTKVIDVVIYFHDNAEEKKFHNEIFNLISTLRRDNTCKEHIDKISIVLKNDYFNKSFNLNSEPIGNNLNYFDKGINSIYLIGDNNNNQVDFYMNYEDNKIFLYNLYVDKIKCYFTSFVSAIKSYINLIQYLLDKDVKIIESIYTIFKKKIFIFKKESFIIKKIINKSFYDILNINIYSSQYSIPLFILNNNKPNLNDDLKIKNLMKIFHIDFEKLNDEISSGKKNKEKEDNEDNNVNSDEEEEDIDKHNINIENVKKIITKEVNKNNENYSALIKKKAAWLLKKYAKILTPIIFNQKYYEYFNSFLLNFNNLTEIFDEIIIFPIPIERIFLTNQDIIIKNNSILKIILYQIKKSKKNKDYNINDLGRLFTIGKIKNVLDTLNLSSRKEYYNLKWKETGNLKLDIVTSLIFLLKHKYNSKYYANKKIVSCILKYIFGMNISSNYLISTSSSNPKGIGKNNLAEVHTQNFNTLYDEMRKYKELSRKKKTNKGKGDEQDVENILDTHEEFINKITSGVEGQEIAIHGRFKKNNTLPKPRKPDIKTVLTNTVKECIIY